MDPGTFDSDRILRLKAIGINRVSVGIQSFDEATLKSCGRAHSADDAVRAIDALKNAGMENFSIDLISSLPGMDLHKWSNTLITACNFKPPHLSVYDLQIEERTAFGRWYTPGINTMQPQNYSRITSCICISRRVSASYGEDFGGYV